MCIYTHRDMIYVPLCGSGFTLTGNNHLPADLTDTTTSHPERKGEHRARDQTRHRSMADPPILLSQEVKVLRLLFLGEATQPVIVHEK